MAVVGAKELHGMLRSPRSSIAMAVALSTSVFPHKSGAPLYHGILLRTGFYPALRRAKLSHVRFHDLRHTFASFLIHANVQPKRIQALLGHSTIRITMDTYGHLMHDAENEAVERVAALVSGSKTVANESEVSQEDRKCLQEMEGWGRLVTCRPSSSPTDRASVTKERERGDGHAVADGSFGFVHTCGRLDEPTDPEGG